jgi:protein HIRA/HIR1
VKGVAWDPVGTYLASQGDDKAVIVWRTEDWSKVAVIKDPFARTVGSSTFSLRLCWSPDGRCLTAVNATNNSQRTAAMLDRETWKVRLCFPFFLGCLCSP